MVSSLLLRHQGRDHLDAIRFRQINQPLGDMPALAPIHSVRVTGAVADRRGSRRDHHRHHRLDGYCFSEGRQAEQAAGAELTWRGAPAARRRDAAWLLHTAGLGG